MGVGVSSGHRRELRIELTGIMRRLHEIQRELGERPARAPHRQRAHRRHHRTLAASVVSAAGGAALTAVVIGHPVAGQSAPGPAAPTATAQTARPRPGPIRATVPPMITTAVRRRTQTPSQRQATPPY